MTPQMDIRQNIAFIQEAETAVTLTLDGIIAINRINAEVIKYHTCLQLVSQGLERLMKLIICIGELEQQGRLSERDEIKKFGHDLLKLADAVVSFADRIGYSKSRPAVKEDIDFIRGDKQLRELLAILTGFGTRARYYDLDTLLDPKVAERPDPSVNFERFMDDIQRRSRDPQAIIGMPDYRAAKAELTETLQRFARALCRMFTFGPLGSHGNQVYHAVSPFLHLWDEDLSTPAKHVFRSVIEG